MTLTEREQYALDWIKNRSDRSSLTGEYDWIDSPWFLWPRVLHSLARKGCLERMRLKDHVCAPRRKGAWMWRIKKGKNR